MPTECTVKGTKVAKQVAEHVSKSRPLQRLIYLSLSNDTFNTLDYTASNDRIIIGKDVSGSDRGQF
jgi:hypothetical protein